MVGHEDGTSGKSNCFVAVIIIISGSSYSYFHVFARVSSCLACKNSFTLRLFVGQTMASVNGVQPAQNGSMTSHSVTPRIR